MMPVVKEIVVQCNVQNPVWSKPGWPWSVRRPRLKAALRNSGGSVFLINEAYTSEQRSDIGVDMGWIVVDAEGRKSYSYWTDGRNMIGWNRGIWSHKDKDGNELGMSKWTLPRDSTRRLMTCRLRNLATGKIVRFSNTHLTAAGAFSKAQAIIIRPIQARFIRDKLAPLKTRPHIFGGDLASTTGAVGGVRWIFEQAGWHDPMRDQAIPMRNRGKKSQHNFSATTWPNGARVDYLLEQDAWVEECSNAFTTGTDHTVLSMTIKLGSGVSTL